MNNQKTVTEIFITHVKPGLNSFYKEWASRIQEIEKTFPGYLGTDIEAPKSNDNNIWVSVLHFDSEVNLDNWLKSEERQIIINESKQFVEEYETHHLTANPYRSWFAGTPKKISVIIKETMLVLLVLFPIIMLEFKFLNPHFYHLNLSIATFIGNALSVSLISFPVMPICLYFLGWWLNPDLEEKQPSKNIFGFVVVIALYLVAILLFAFV